MTFARSRFRHRGSAVALTIAAVLAFGTLFAAPASANSAESGPVTIIGEPIIGQTLTVDKGDWDAGTTFTYQWHQSHNGADVAGATSDSLLLTDAERWDYLEVTVTGTLSGTATEITSSNSVRVLRPLMTAGTLSISGSAVVGNVLTATAADWPEGATINYYWGYNDGEFGDSIEGATGRTFTVPADKVGLHIAAMIYVNLPGFEEYFLATTTDIVPPATTPVATVPAAQAPADTALVATVPAAQAPADTAPVATSAQLTAFLTAAGVVTGTAASAGLPATGLDVTKPYTATVDWAAADGFVDVYAYSTPTLVGTFPIVNGQVHVVLSSAMLSALAAGSHTLVVSGQSSGAVQAVAFSITKTLAATGVDPIVPLGSAALLLLLGAALVVVRRRRTLA
ncbi:hypothetical protein [Cryobacterium serini]|uniref:LPXTG cell wall anchor domain-containing protein n=1 Tax=Cryobacterium serini TaxID=1259201 RepID=A0A4R9BSF0_9MICO|nr:hypothetical protein [Cryobacterium serini]TFD90051.1 hypothetical protein E3T51_04950 [Cryobacterium serini]